MDRNSEFDVFLSYNRRDRKFIAGVVSALATRGIRVWYDECLLPGQQWQPAIEGAIRNAKAAIVAIGDNGLGPWELQECEAILSLHVERKIPVIPFLFGSVNLLEVPLLLRAFTSVDACMGLSEITLDQLELGITGEINPSRREGVERVQARLSGVIVDCPY